LTLIKKIFMKLGWTEILLIAFVVLLLFGGKKIPELMRGLGRGFREFKDAKDNVKKELEESPEKGK
jgi:sec-independent protein translocase protein TatA